MKVKNIAALLAAALVMSVASAADDSGTSKAFQDCMAEAQSNVMGIKECSDTEAKKLSKDLVAALKVAGAKLSKERAAALRKSQAAWEKFHKANCDVYYDPDGGQMSTLGVYACDISMYSARVKEVKDLVAN